MEVLIIFSLTLVIAILWAKGIHRMSKEHPFYTGEDLFSEKLPRTHPDSSVMYTRYCEFASSLEEIDYDYLVDDPHQNCTRIMSENEFWERVSKDSSFAQKFNWIEI